VTLTTFGKTSCLSESSRLHRSRLSTIAMISCALEADIAGSLANTLIEPSVAVFLDGI
jgi:hypothetical protein